MDELQKAWVVLLRRWLLAFTVLALIMSGIWYIFIRVPPVNYVAQGNNFLAEKQYEDALNSYAMAMRLEPGNLSLALNSVRLIKSFPPLPAAQSLRVTQYYRNLLIRILRIDPVQREATQTLLGLYYDLARMVGLRQVWDNLYNMASESVNKSHVAQIDVDPAVSKYYAIARARRLNQGDLTGEFEPPWIKEVLRNYSDDGDVVRALSAWYAAMARLATDKESAALRDRAKKFSFDLINNYLLVHPDSLCERLSLAQLFRDNNEKEALLAEWQKISPLLDGADMLCLCEAADFFQGFVRDTSILAAFPNERQRLIDLLKKYPNEPSVLIAVAELEKSQNDNSYLDVLQVIWQENISVPPGAGALAMLTFRAMAGNELGNRYLYLAQETTNLTERQAYVDQAKNVVKTLREFSGQSEWVDLLEGKLAMTDQSYENAANFFRKAAKKTKEENLEVIYLSARSLLVLGQTGAAILRYQQIINDLQGQYFISAYLELATIYNDLSMPKKAAEILARADKFFPKNPDVALMQVLTLARQYDLSVLNKEPNSATLLAELKKRLPEVNWQSNPNGRLLASRLAAEGGNRDEAIAILTAAVKAYPEDQNLKRNLLSLLANTGRKDQALALLKGWPMTPDRVIDEVYITGNSNIFWSAAEKSWGLADLLTFSRYYRQTNPDYYWPLATNLLAEAEKLAPDDVAVWSEKFAWDIQQKRGPQAADCLARLGKIDPNQAGQLVRRGRYELMAGNYSNAVASLQEALNVNPLQPDGWRLLGLAQQSLGSFPEAKNSYEKALADKPNDRATLVQLVGMLIQERQYKPALDQMDKALPYFPYDRELLDQYANLLERSGFLARAISFRQEKLPLSDENNRQRMAGLYLRLNEPQKLEEILSDRSNAQNLFFLALARARLGQRESGEKMLLDYIHAQKVPDSNALLFLAEFYFLAGASNDQVLAALKDASQFDKSPDQRAGKILARWYYDTGDLQASRQRYKLLCEKNPSEENWLSYISLLVEGRDLELATKELDAYKLRYRPTTRVALLEGWLLFYKKDYPKAQGAFDRAVKNSPDRAPVYLERALFAAALPNGICSDQVVADLQKAISLDPNLLYARELLAWLYGLPCHGREKDAEELLEGILERDKMYRQAYPMLAQLYLEYEDSWKFYRLIQTAKKLFPEDSDWFLLEVQMASKMGKTNEAIAAVQNYFQANPTNASLYLSVQVLLAANQKTNALNLLLANPKLVEQEPPLLFARGAILSVTGQAEAAKDSWQKALRLTASNRWDSMSVTFRQFLPAKEVATLLQEESGRRPGDYLLALNLAETYELAGNYAAAIQAYKDVLPHLTDTTLQTRTSRNLGNCYRAKKEYELARRAYQQALEFDENDAATLNNLAFLLLTDLRQANLALPLAQKAKSIGSTDPRVQASILNTLARTQKALGFTEAAEGLLRKSKRIQ